MTNLIPAVVHHYKEHYGVIKLLEAPILNSLYVSQVCTKLLDERSVDT